MKNYCYYCYRKFNSEALLQVIDPQTSQFRGYICRDCLNMQIIASQKHLSKENKNMNEEMNKIPETGSPMRYDILPYEDWKTAIRSLEKESEELRLKITYRKCIMLGPKPDLMTREYHDSEKISEVNDPILVDLQYQFERVERRLNFVDKYCRFPYEGEITF